MEYIYCFFTLPWASVIENSIGSGSMLKAMQSHAIWWLMRTEKHFVYIGDETIYL